MIVSFRLPSISLGAVSNMVGLLGLVAVAVAVGGLLGSWWWTCLSGGVFAVGLAVLAGMSAQAQAQAEAAGQAPAVLRPAAEAS
ncbi:hypothetical protein [Sphaerisporangium sp. TRM90804]|uniref:hypothetical protein n=1 Tax=Sphaerisporangium sp. TRM90804 TaxID=3031113 RepID=UPI0024490947|nr:hypothetical protein [Sphaerisporangium sp. TRM90804]MDH2425774.1 hypothetical protein [Sphaerisporangium sp. TRM90804]